MSTRRFLCAVIVVLVFATGAFAARSIISSPVQVRGGVLRYLGTTEEAFQKGVDELTQAMRFAMMGVDTRKYAAEILQTLKIFKERDSVITFFDSLTAMLMALNADRIDEVSLPESTARYVMNSDPAYKFLFTLHMPSAISFGFRSDSTSLRDEFNGAIASMKEDGTLRELEHKYIGDGVSFISEAVSFANFPGADEIKIAVTGDMPPVDYVDEAGMAAGYNTAVISEIGKRIKKNIEILSIEAGARSAALTSGRADVIFWYRSTEGVQLPEDLDVKDVSLNKVISDTTEGIILSEPYYRWESVIFLTK